MENNPQKFGEWWKNGVIYQIFPRTFADANGDGSGDLQGIIQKLDYLNDGNIDSEESLHIDAIWLSPINKSPMYDNGYDISDYCQIDPVFGNIDDFETLIAEAHQRNIKVILDLVINHTSNKHPWFEESCGEKDNPKSDWYHWRNPNSEDDVPNNWLSYFGGTAWTYCETRQQYYHHTFDKRQPDLNWRNPEVKEAIYQMIRFWLDKGVDGFRLDASSVYSKDKDYRDNPLKAEVEDKEDFSSQHHLYDKDLPENHQIIKEIRAIIDEYDDRLLIGETFISSGLYESVMFRGVNNDELHLPFTFDFPFSPWYPGHLQKEIAKKELMTPDDAWSVYFLDNHDLSRHLSRWVDCSLCDNSVGIAKAAATILLTVKGTPVLYYGQEIGMVDHNNIPSHKLRDRATIAHEGESASRDKVRTPMQWDNSNHGGFSFGKDVEPWLPVNDNYQEVNVAAEFKDEGSILNFYQALIRVRKKSHVLQKGCWRTLIHYPYEHLAYVRETESDRVLVVINFSHEKELQVDEYIDWENWQVLLSTDYPTDLVMDLPKILKPFETSIYQKR
ncbi:alpha-glucosidase [Waterburya agarophytonicola K14]|uniref:Alpha-glucosidase n=1 Tax=Waterburya agarophytonicola KI4 TaxID=2874699 RepID=A0A964BSY6_9CYAN|nr:alpha-glucosidase [Waterburya agarophytonicola KI4]